MPAASTIPVIVYFACVFVAIVATFRGFHAFYRTLDTYHGTPEDYDRVVGYRTNEDIDANPDDFINADDLGGVDEVELYDENGEAEKHGRKPIVVVDLEAEERVWRGERLRRKITLLWFYTSVLCLGGTAIAVMYSSVATGYGISDGIASLRSILAVVVLVALVHLGIRIASFAEFDFLGRVYQPSTQLGKDLHNFAFSFFLSLLLVWLFAITNTVVTAGFGAITSSLARTVFDFSSNDAAWILVAIVVMPGITTILGESYLYWREKVPDEQMEHDRRRVDEIEVSD